MGDKPKRKTSRSRSTKNSTETFEEPLPDDSDAAEILKIPDEEKFEDAISKMAEGEKAALRVVWKKTKNARLRSYTTTPHPSRLSTIRDDETSHDDDASPEMGSGATLKICAPPLSEPAEKEVRPPTKPLPEGVAPTEDLTQPDGNDVFPPTDPGAPAKNYFFNWNSYSAELRRQYSVGGAPFKPDIMLAEIQNCIKRMDSSNNVCRAVMMISHLLHHTASELSLMTKCNEQLELLLADFTSGIKEDCDNVYNRLEAIEGDISMLIDDTVKIDDNLSENVTACATKRDELLANITEIKDKIVALENRPASFAAVASGGVTSAGSKRKTGTATCATDAKRVKVGALDVVGAATTTGTAAAPTSVAVASGAIPKEFRGRDGKDDILVTLTDPLDILGYMFPLTVISEGKKFPCIALALMMVRLIFFLRLSVLDLFQYYIENHQNIHSPICQPIVFLKSVRGYQKTTIFRKKSLKCSLYMKSYKINV